jgi:hypothetical protein
MPMLKLMRKELIFNRNNLLIVLAIMTGFLMFFLARTEHFKSSGFMMFSAFYVGASLCVTLASQEDKHKTGALTCSLPCRRKDVVRARFALTWALMLATLIYTTFLAAVLPFSRAEVGQALNLKVVLVTLLILTVIFAVMLPFIIRFGVMGVLVVLVAAQLLGVITLFLASFFKAGRGSLLSPLSAAIRGLKFLAGPDSQPVHLVLTATGILVLNAAALVISQALYARKEL